MSHLKSQRKRIANPYRTDSRIALVVENHKSTSDGPKNIAHAWMRLPKITPIATAAERNRRENAWVLVLNSSGPKGSMNQREDDAEARRIKDRLYEESGKGNTRLHPSEQVRQRPGQSFAWHDEGTERVDPKTGWKWYPSTASSSSSSTWWKSSEKW